jgi:hypothetical protein
MRIHDPELPARGSLPSLMTIAGWPIDVEDRADCCVHHEILLRSGLLRSGLLRFRLA